MLEFSFNTEKDALDSLDRMRCFVKLYGILTLEDAYSLMGVNLLRYGKDQGWTDLRTAYVCKQFDGATYKIVMPPMEKVPVVSISEEQAKNIFERVINNQSASDMVNHPAHYKSETGLEVIEAIEAFTFDLTGIEAVATGNVIKYICRWKKKNGLQDLKKCQWYLNYLINHLEKLEKENSI